MKTERVLEIQEHPSDFRETFSSAFRNIWFYPYIKFFPDVEFLHDCTVSLHTGMQRIKICKHMFTTMLNGLSWLISTKRLAQFTSIFPVKLFFNTADTKFKHLDKTSLLIRLTYYPKTFSHLAFLTLCCPLGMLGGKHILINTLPN